MLALNTLIISVSAEKREEVLRMINLVGLEVQDEDGKKMIIKD